MEAEQFKLIDTAIGMIFVYLIVAIAVTAGVELIASMLRLRSVNLVQGLLTMLGETPAASPRGAGGLRSRLAGWFIGHSKVDNPAKPVVGNEAAAAPPDSLTAQVLRHPLISDLAVGDRVAPRIDPKLFATALVAVLNDVKNNEKPFDDINKAFANIGELVGSISNTAVKERLTPIVAQAQATATEETAKAQAGLNAIAKWYDQAMSQASDWYKTRIQGVTLALAALVVVSCNIDSVRVAEALWSDGALRQSFAQQAVAAAGDPNYLNSACPPDPNGAKAVESVDCQGKALRAAIQQLNGLPVGWRSVDYSGGYAASARALAGHIPGWLLTIAAASLGAPFWFGLLQRAAPLRKSDSDSSGK